MFDVGFLELAVILVLGLLVLGPERLPKAAQKIGYWFGKARRYVEGMKSQVEAEFDSSEVKRLLRNQEVQIRELQSKLTETGDEISSEYRNQFENDGDTSTELASKKEIENSKPTEPQYDIIEDDDGSWGDDHDEFGNNITEENKSAESTDNVKSDKA